MKRPTPSKTKLNTATAKAPTDADAKAMIYAINTNKFDAVATALAARHDINAAICGHTPLFRAVLQARPEMVQFLLEHGADWRTRDTITRWTPLMMATINAHRSSRRHFTGRAIKDSKRVIKVLEAAGASDPETSRVLGNSGNDATLAAHAAERQTRADERIIELDGAVVIIPPRMYRANQSRFETVEDYARRLGRTQLLQSLLKAQ